MLNRILAAVAVVVSALALVVSVTHRGPSGPPGPQGRQGQQGSTGHSAETAHLGICFSDYIDSATTDVGAIVLESPVLTNGVPSCPDGQFVSIVPQPDIASAQGNGAAG